MTRSTRGMIGYGTRARVDPAFDRFLQAPFDEDRQEQLLTVVSVLARLGLDPWHEAAVLAALPPEAAIKRLTALFEKIPDTAVAPRDGGRIASRLVGLLPREQRARDALPADPVTGDDVIEQADPTVGTDATEGSSLPPSTASRPWLKLAAIVVLLIIAVSAMFTGSPLGRLLDSGSAQPAAATAPSPLGVDRR